MFSKVITHPTKKLFSQVSIGQPIRKMSRSSALGESKYMDLSVGKIHYREVGTGHPIIFYHGALNNGDFWRLAVPSLAKNYRCICPDLPLGSHSIPLNEDADLTPPSAAQIIIDFTKNIEAEYKERPTIVANDSAGAFTQIALTKSPETFNKVVLTSCDAFDNFIPWKVIHFLLLPRIPGAMWAFSKIASWKPLIRSVFGLGLLTKKGLPDDLIESYLDPMKDPLIQRDLSKLIMGVSSKYTMEAAEQLHNYKNPVLLAWSKEDRLFPAEHAERLAKIFPNAKLDFIEDSWTYVGDDNPEALVAAIERFLAK